MLELELCLAELTDKEKRKLKATFLGPDGLYQSSNKKLMTGDEVRDPEWRLARQLPQHFAPILPKKKTKTKKKEG